jgi:hypothetical protein
MLRRFATWEPHPCKNRTDGTPGNVTAPPFAEAALWRDGAVAPQTPKLRTPKKSGALTGVCGPFSKVMRIV